MKMVDHCKKGPTFEKRSDHAKKHGYQLVDQMVTNWSTIWSDHWQMVDHLAKWLTILLPTKPKMVDHLMVDTKSTDH